MSEARERLRKAIEEVDAEANGERPANELLTHYLVITSHSAFVDDGESNQISLLFGELGMPNWQALGLLASADADLRHRAVHGDSDDL